MDNIKVILASKSPRRQELLKLMNIDFRVVLKEVDESYPEGLTPIEIALHIAEKKCHAFDEIVEDEAVVTADTIVSIDDQILGKPESPEHAIAMLQTLSGRKHQVITGVVLLRGEREIAFADITEVWFHPLTAEQIAFYVDKYQPYVYVCEARIDPAHLYPRAGKPTQCIFQFSLAKEWGL